ncbi:polysaccharide biosynthesis tyrosine autokinase [Ktedonosporobacter rubrisoli]|uniref:Polysaccharide biosynthesis tyrosine autokinase n=1 Tax=Ktedonosporobacter rubrisoli TaxID=2509675 RepID=A0A4P6JS79_KTERU|nr:polysaccharide biosynthesis tyrosine autokinase [Ktedonosporobacter rubrisoli]QBD78388.1 polysaccharide biosynthesis tyrosine autokinase [Ktedonosporobacter rubrisoli]
MRSSLSRYTLIVKRWAWVIVLGVVICGSVTYGITKLMQPVYQATAQVILTIGTNQSPYESTNAVIALQPTYAQLVTTPQVLQPVAARHGLTLKGLSNLVVVNAPSNTPIIKISVNNSDPRFAAQLANEVAASFAQYTNTSMGGQVQPIIVQALPPTDPSQPKPSLDAGIGALVGLGLALALIVVFEWLDDRLKGPEEAQRLLGVETLTVIPELSRKQRIKNAEDTPALAEGCRILCANLNRVQGAHPFKLVMITSALAGEGKSTIAANLASFLAMSGKRVLLVDADLRHPVLDQHFQLDNRQGLSNAFLEMWTQVQPQMEGQPTELPSLRVLTAGVLPSNPSELLQSPLAQQLFKHFRESKQFDYIIFDTPPLLPIADAQILASYVDVSVLVVDASKTARSLLTRTKEVLTKAGTEFIGVVLNKSQWSEYGFILEYLGSVQQRPRADISMSIPPTTASSNGSVDGDTSITASLRKGSD